MIKTLIIDRYLLKIMEFQSSHRYTSLSDNKLSHVPVLVCTLNVALQLEIHAFASDSFLCFAIPSQGVYEISNLFHLNQQFLIFRHQRHRKELSD